MNIPKFEYWKSTLDGMWYFHFRAANGKLVCQSEGYTRKAGCLNGIESIWRSCRSKLGPVQVEIKDRVKSRRK